MPTLVLLLVRLWLLGAIIERRGLRTSLIWEGK